jgi:hypothetical protein
MNTSIPASHFNVFTIEEFDAPTKEYQHRKAKSWTKAAWLSRTRKAPASTSNFRPSRSTGAASPSRPTRGRGQRPHSRHPRPPLTVALASGRAT